MKNGKFSEAQGKRRIAHPTRRTVRLDKRGNGGFPVVEVREVRAEVESFGYRMGMQR